MKIRLNLIWLLGILGLLTSCAGGSGGVYRHHYGPSPWWGAGGYYRDRVVVVPVPDEPVVEATPLPSGPEHMPDMGMPDVDLGWD